jgi:hypothetical protein
MLRDPRHLLAGAQRMARVDAATGTTVTEPSIIPPGYRPDLYTPLLSYQAPVYSNATKSPISDFTPFTVPREATRTGLSTTPTDEVTPVAAGDITTALNTITPQHVMGSYAFSRDLALSSNPAIDMIARNAMDEEWLKDIEARAIAFVTTAANNTAVSVTYADGQTLIAAIRGQEAGFRIRRLAPVDVVIMPGAKEYAAAILADDASKRPLLGWNTPYNPLGGQSDGAMEANVLGVPVVPDGAAPMPATKMLFLKRSDFYCFETPVWNFRFDANGTNPLVITLVKYSGVAFWTRRKEGVAVSTNTTPIVLDLDVEGTTTDDTPAADEPANEHTGRKR